VIEVVGPDPCELVAGVLIDPVRKRPVLLRSQRLAHPAVGDVADQHMLEPERAIAGDGRELFGYDELTVEQAVEERVDVEVGHQPIERAPPEHPADERGALEDALLACSQPVDPCGDRRLHAVGNAVQLFVLPEHACDLLEEQGVALRSFEDERPLCRGDLGPREQGIR
jgi:hypothetical protein